MTVELSEMDVYRIIVVLEREIKREETDIRDVSGDLLSDDKELALMAERITANSKEFIGYYTEIAEKLEDAIVRTR